MTEKVCYWDSDAKEQRERDETPEETAERLSRKNAPPTVPQSVPMLNAELAMIDAGWLDDVEAFIAAIPGSAGKRAKAFMKRAHTMKRDNDLVLAYAASRGKTEAELDALFIAAGALDA